MEETTALTIVSALANGVHPLTGELFAVDSPYQSPDVIRALYCAVRALEAAGDDGRPLAELAQAHGRTRGGIQARLVRHGRLAPEGGRPIGGPGKWRPGGASASRAS
jgi:hypothetical protein